METFNTFKSSTLLDSEIYNFKNIKKFDAKKKKNRDYHPLHGILSYYHKRITLAPTYHRKIEKIHTINNIKGQGVLGKSMTKF